MGHRVWGWHICAAELCLSDSLTSGDINEDTLETENAAAAAAAAFTASTHLKEAVLGRFSPYRSLSLQLCWLHHPCAGDNRVWPLLCRAPGVGGMPPGVLSWQGAIPLGVLSWRGRGGPQGCSPGVPRDALPSIKGSPESCGGWGLGWELAASGRAAAALSWCRMRPCVWPCWLPPSQLAMGVSVLQ